MLRLRPYKTCDAAQIIDWIKDERSFRQWSAAHYDHYPISADTMNTYYKTFEKEDNLWAMSAFDETGLVGHLIMRFLDDTNQTLHFGFIIVDSNKRGKGYGKEMVKLALHYAFTCAKAEKVTLGVFSNNTPAYQLYKSIGFTEALPTNVTHYDILGEDWPCIKLEYLR